MIKNKIKAITLITILLLSVNADNVFAKNAKAKYESRNINTGIEYKYNGQIKTYANSTFKVKFDDLETTFTGHCIDANYAAGEIGGWFDLDCTLTKANYALNYVLSNLTDDPITNTIAMRMVSIKTGVSKATKKAGTAIKKYINGETDYFYGTNDAGRKRISDAFNLYKDAIEYHEEKGGDTPATEERKLTFTKTSSTSTTDSYKATYTVTSSEHLDTVNFSCKENSNCTIESESWNGTSGTVSIAVVPYNCSYTISADYNDSDEDEDDDDDVISNVYMCDGGYRFQRLVVETDGIIPGVDIPVEEDPDEEFTDITGVGSAGGEVEGEYYQAHCVNNCDTKTEINIPPYCDDATNQEITITGPTNIKQCILKNEDEAGNTYQSTAVSSSNPYCSVYCKEDYKMTLPGAKYAESGRYFNLDDTIVKGTRSCYITGSQSGNNTEGIDLVQYKKDMAAAQKSLFDAYNSYSELKALYDNKSSATESTTTSCNGTQYKKYTLSGVSYTKYTYECSESTGKCTFTSGTGTTSKTWGQSITTSTSTDTKTNLDAPLQGYSCTKNNTTGKYTCTKTTCTDGSVTNHGDAPTEPSTTAISTATTNVQNTIDNLESCYGWTNDFCFEPEVEFDYNEQYKTDINYGKIPGSETTETTTSIGTSIDDAYNTNGTGSITETIEYVGCTSTGCTTNGNKAENVSSSVTYVKKVVKKSAKYNNRQEFQTNYPHGTIDKCTSAMPDDIRENYSYLGAVFPLALKTTTGVYNWTLNFEKIGQYNNESSCRLGRLNQVAQSLGKTLEDDIGYVCVYVVDCDDCDYSCECPTNLPDGYSCVKRSQFVCEIIEPEPTCDECDVYCVNCIFDGKDTYSYRTISLTDTNPNNRDVGVNWSNEKGRATTEEIEGNSENIYKEPEYSYTITATQMKNIRDYNKTKGTYIAEDLDYGTLGGYSNIYGTSSFLDDGETKGFFTENKRNGTWTLWTGTINSQGSGPAWK